MTHICEVAGCQYTTRRPWYLVCDDHWKALNGIQQGALVAAREYHQLVRGQVLRHLDNLEAEKLVAR